MKKLDKVFLILGLSIIVCVFVVYSVLDKLGLVSDTPILWYESILGSLLTLGESFLLIEWGKYLQRKEDK